jgi:hypothetical protein
MQSALAFAHEDDEAQKQRLELVTGAPVPPEGPEQLPLIRMLEVVRDRVEAVHAGQKTLTAEVRDIKANLPLLRRPLSRRAQELHLRVIWSRRNGLCPCCQETPVCNASGRLDGSEFDHWYSRNQNRVTQTWLVCGDCNRRMLDTDFKSTARSAFEAYQQALRPFMGNRQIPFNLVPLEEKTS